jgi:hypothetical protein
MLDKLGYATFIFFGAMNVVAMPIIYFFYPEVANKSLEEINLLFTSDSVLVSKNMAAYETRLNEAGGDLVLASRRLFAEVNGYDAHDDALRGDSSDEKGAFETVASEKV